MMQRIPEPELMNGHQQAKAYALADFEGPNSSFINAFQELAGNKEIYGRVVDLGCGPADILIRFAGLYRQTTCLGIDGSANMLDFGEQAITDAGLGKRVELVEATLPLSEKTQTNFDVILSNSLLHHLPTPHTLWQAIRQLGKKGSLVLVMDLLRPLSPEDAQGIVERYSGSEPQVLKDDFYHSLLAAYTLDEVRLQLQQSGLDCLQAEQCSDRHFCVRGQLR